MKCSLVIGVGGTVSLMKKGTWRVGDWVIYRKQKRSESPGPRAEEIHPDEHGERYSYLVDKYWLIENIKQSGELQLITKTGKRHVISPDDYRLRSPNWWERWRFASRFQEVEKTLETRG